MLDQRAWDQVADVVHGEDLYRADHRLIFGAIAELVEPRSAARRGHCRRALAAFRTTRGWRRRRVSRSARRGHAECSEHPRVCADRARARDAAQAHRDRGRHRGERAFDAGSHGRGDRRSCRAAGVRDRGRRPAGAGVHVAEGHPAEDDRPARYAEPLAERHHGRVDRLHRDGQDDRRFAARRAHHHCWASVHGQVDAGRQHRRARGDRQRRPRRHLQHGDVCRAAELQDAELDRTREPDAAAQRQALRGRLAARALGRVDDVERADLHRRRRRADADRGSIACSRG